MHLSFVLEVPPKVPVEEVKIKEEKKDQKQDNTYKNHVAQDINIQQEFAFQNLIKTMTLSESLQSVHLSNNGFSEQECTALQVKFNVPENIAAVSGVGLMAIN